MNANQIFELAGEKIELGQRRDLDLAVAQSYTGVDITIPIHIWRGNQDGPNVFISGAIHGDELNGTGIVRELILNHPFDLNCGSLVLIPVVNILGFERHSRYLPDRRDLNRCFPGSDTGSLASRYAYTFFREIVAKCDYGIDLHSATIRRTNFPNVRADLTNPQAARLAVAFGCELIVHGKGTKGSLRRSACHEGCATILLEAGEAWKIEPSVVEFGLRGIRNVLIELGMIKEQAVRSAYQARIKKTKWVRAKVGGMLQFHVSPGELVDRNQPIATTANILGREQEVICSPIGGIILGMTTLPAVTPGNPICHIAYPVGGVKSIRRALNQLSKKSLHERLRDDLATNVTVSDITNSPNISSGEKC